MAYMQEELKKAIEEINDLLIGFANHKIGTIVELENINTDKPIWYISALQFALFILQDLADGKLVGKNEPNPNNKEPLNYNSTLAYFADQLNIALWKAMEMGKYFQERLVRPMGIEQITHTLANTISKEYGGQVDIGSDLTTLADALLTAMKGENNEPNRGL